MSINDWTFKSADIVKKFDNHVREQLPFYDMVSDSICHIVKHYLPHDGIFYDIGSATGNLGKKLETTLKDRNVKSIAIDSSSEMCKNSYYNGIGDVICKNAEEVKYNDFDVAVIFLTLMFINPNKQKKLLHTLKHKVNKGGCIILCERFLPVNSYTGIINQRLSLLGKLNNNIDPYEIIKKELSLSGIQRPLKYESVKELGFVDFFQLGDFRGLFFEKEIF